ncbi:hypothetical protein L3X38_010892 [Prunus dulcis]|uniref:CCHC-type domain-containing protein n=1 Tax=Prunus dulcis TaxID=3755 RepID=A0AAD4WH30_PRUDU|nr:hypothetical protein L3X38_010892 [Prunus dulcis]
MVEVLPSISVTSKDTLVVSLSNLVPEGVLTLDIVKDSMFNEAARRKEQGVIAESEALVSEYRGRTNNRKFHRRDKSKGRSRDGLRERSKTIKDLECYHCGRISHMKRECWLFKREQDRGNEKSDTRHTTATTSGGNEKHRSYDLEIYEVIKAEVDKLNRVDYPTWLANVVMVRKPKKGQRMCVDYTNLNRAFVNY